MIKNTLTTCLRWQTALAASIALLSSPVQAKQCIWNNGGYVLTVEWHRTDRISMAAKPENLGPIKFAHFNEGRVTLALGQGSCAGDDSPHFALVRVVGCSKVKIAGEYHPCKTGEYVRIPQGTAMARRVMLETSYRGGGKDYELTALPPAPVECWNTNGICLAQNADRSRVDTADVILLIQPSNTHHLDFWGTVFDVQWGQGGPL